MSERPRIDSVGWIFFGMMLAIALGPCIYAVLKVTNDSITIGMRVGAGITLAVFAAAFASWAVNSLLQWRAAPDVEPESSVKTEVASLDDTTPKAQLKSKSKQTKKKKKK